MKKIFFSILLLPAVFLTGCSSTTLDAAKELSTVQNSGQISLSEQAHDWGDIDITGGNQNYTFSLKNSGSHDLILKGGSTSCMCTTATLEFTDGTKSPRFGMHQNPKNWVHAVKPGEEFEAHITFDPMAHGPNGTGAIKRSFDLVTSAPIDGKIALSSPIYKKSSVTRLNVSGLVLPTEAFQKKHENDKEDHERGMMEKDMKEMDDHDTDRMGMMNDHDSEENHHREEESANMPEYEINGYDVLKKVQSKSDTVLLDVRESSELQETGAIEGTIHIPLGSLSLNTLQEKNISKDDEIITICRSGNRSHQAYELLTALGFTNVKSMQGGIVHWQEDNRPLIKWDVSADKNEKNSEFTENSTAPKISFDKPEEDLGMVQPTEVKSTTFTVKNEGDSNLIIGNITTSCMCTSAELSSKEIQPGQSATLKVTFDPNVHEEPEEKFKRTVFLETNDPNMPEAEVSIWVDIDESPTKTSSEKIIEISAKRWEYDQPEIRVKQGENVRLKINNIDTTHGIDIPSLNQKDNNEILLDTSQKGEFEFFCANFCGSGHSDMKGKIIID